MKFLKNTLIYLLSSVSCFSFANYSNSKDNPFLEKKDLPPTTTLTITPSYENDTKKNFPNKLTITPSYDLNFSPYCGAQNILTIHRSLELAENYFFKSLTHPVSDNLSVSIVAGINRFLEYTFIWLPLDVYMITLQHEVFGHGYRIRDLGKNVCKVIKYNIDIPLPYGYGGGYTRFYDFKMTKFQETTMALGGTEANLVLSHQITLEWLKDKKINPLQTFLYFNSKYDLTGYVLLTKADYNQNLDGNDISIYFSALADIYPNNSFSMNKMHTIAKLNYFLDPITYFSTFAYFNYIITGKSSKIPMIKIKNIRYLPSFKFGLAPFGVEYYFDNYICNKKGPMYIYFKKGNYWENDFYGAGFENPYIWNTNNFSFGLKADVWYQPQILDATDATYCYEKENKIFYIFDENKLKKKSCGASFAFLLNYNLTKNSLYFNSALGYKTKGYVMGQSIKQSPILKIGFSGNF